MVSLQRWIVLVTATLTLTCSQVSNSRASPPGSGFSKPVTGQQADFGFKVAAAQQAPMAEHSQEVRRLMAAAKEKGERELDLVWSATSLGGSEGAKKFEALFNRMYGMNIRMNFTPGPSMTEMAGKVTEEVAAGRKASTDILVGTESHYRDLLDRGVLEEYEYTVVRLTPTWPSFSSIW